MIDDLLTNVWQRHQEAAPQEVAIFNPATGHKRGTGKHPIHTPDTDKQGELGAYK